VGADAVLDSGDTVRGPAFGSQDLAGKFRRGVMVAVTGRQAVLNRAGGSAFDIVQQGGGLDDVQVCGFDHGQMSGAAVDPLDVFEIMDGVGGRVPRPGLFYGWNGEAPWNSDDG
jgi:hypothetical protein